AVAVVAIISLGIWWGLFRNRSPAWKQISSDIQQDVPPPDRPELCGINPGRYEAPDNSVKPTELAAGPARKNEIAIEAYELPASEPAASELHTPDITPATTPYLAPRIPTRSDTPPHLPDLRRPS